VGLELDSTGCHGRACLFAYLRSRGLGVNEQAPGRQGTAAGGDLIDLGDLFDSRVLPDDLAAQCRFEFGCVIAAKGRIECGIKTGFHRYCIPLKMNRGAQHQFSQMGQT